MTFSTQEEVDLGQSTDTSVCPLTLKNGFAISLTAAGFIKFPSWMSSLIGVTAAPSLIIQWGVTAADRGSSVTAPIEANFQIPFPTACWVVIPIITQAATLASTTAVMVAWVESANPLTSFGVKKRAANTIGSVTTVAISASPCYFIAIGH